MKRGIRLYRKFNRRPAARVFIQHIPITETLVDLGRAVAVAYESDKEGTRRHYEHKFSKAGTRVLASENGQVLLITGENLRVSDWIRGG